MSIDRDQAIRIFSEALSAQRAVDPDSIVERDCGWLMRAESRSYLQARDRSLRELGGSFALVERADGRLHEFMSSRYSYEDALRIHELGYLKFEHWDIEVTAVGDAAATVRLLTELEVESVVREGANGVFWTKRERYSAGQLSERLERLPARFYIGEARIRWTLLESLPGQSALTCRLLEHDWGDASATPSA